MPKLMLPDGGRDQKQDSGPGDPVLPCFSLTHSGDLGGFLPSVFWKIRKGGGRGQLGESAG